MRILYLCADHGIPVFGRRGCSTHVRETCRALGEAGHRVTLLCSRLGDEAQAKASGLDARELPPTRSKKLGYDLRNAWHDRRFHKAARKIVETEKIEAIYERLALYSLTGTRLGSRYDLPRIVEVNAFLSVEHKKKLHFQRLARRVERRIARNAPALVVVSQPLEDSLVEMGADRGRIVQMPIAVDMKHFRPDPEGAAAARKQWDLPVERYVVGYIGGLAEWHGISMLYDLARKIGAECDDFTILVVGGEEREAEAHRQRVIKEGLERRLLFTGSVPYEQAPRYVNAMDVALVPDTLHWTCPTKMFEYQASGVPTIAPRYPAIVGAMDHGQEGMLFEPRAMDQAARAILDLKEKPDLRRAMGERARSRVGIAHSWESNVEGIARLFGRMQSGELPLSGPVAP